MSILHRRRLGADAAEGVAVLDCVSRADVAGLRLFCRAGVGAGSFDPAPRRGCLTIEEMRPVAGALMVVARGPQGRPLALADGGRLRPAPNPPETALLAGRNCLFGLRLEESAETVAEWLGYHATRHGATGALIVNRAPPGGAGPDADADAFAARLAERLAGLPGLPGLPGLTVVLVDSPVPLGKPETGPENHPFLAPDAPGKDRMTPPAPDPWRAPLGEGLLHEAMKWRFLAEARAVLCLDVTDILALPEDAAAPTAFDLCEAAASGVVLLAGRRAYPWRIRKGAAARFADHLCRQFDNRRGMARWGAAPARAGLERTWRLTRVAYARPDPGGIVPFWRAMALRVPGHAPSVLAPKTSLIEDPGLLRLAEEAFGHRPIRPPASSPRPAPAAAAEAGRTCIVTTMKNEGPFILEWLAHHRAIGVEDFLIYTNDCTDGTDRMLEMLQRKGLVQHRENPFRAMPGLKPQHAALQAAESEPVIRDCGWAICMDVDEFINIKIGDGTLAALYEAMGEANMISLTWRLFGNADVVAYEDRFVTEQFTLCAPELIRKPHQAWGFKTLFRNIDIYKKLGVHRPKGLRPDLWDQVRWLNGSGRPMPREIFRNGWRSTLETYGYDWVQLNHYAVRSVESFLVKRDRGRVNHVDRDQGLNYWFRMNHNAERETSILRLVPRARAEFDRLMADPEIRAAHLAAVAAHRERIAALMQRESYALLHRELAGARMRRLSRMLHHFGAAVFGAGPDVIPADLHERDLPADFFFTIRHEGDARH